MRQVSFMDRSLLSRSVNSLKWNIISNLVLIAFGFVQTVLLARLLPVRVFGVFALAHAIILVTGIVANMGMGEAFVHRAEETRDEARAAAVHFSLKSSFTIIWTVLLIGSAWLLTRGDNKELWTALLVLTLANAVTHLTQTAHIILIRRVMHERLAILKMLNSILTMLLAVGLALMGAELWALLISSIVTAILSVTVLYVWRPVWKPRFGWDKGIARYYWRFGSRNVVARLLLYSLDRVDDLWTGWFLGSVPLGYYSQAYQFASYPRLVLSEPVKGVASGMYAELKGDRRRLSRAFSETNSAIIRVGFLLAGGLALLAPEFIRLVLGEKWLPMLTAFRLMLVFTMLDPLRETTAALFTAVGRPDIVVRTRMVQLAVLGIAMFLLGSVLGIAGVALAVDAMLVVGIVHMLYLARTYVDYSVKTMFIVPTCAMGVGLALGYGAGAIPEVAASDWSSFAIKSIVYLLTYGIIWLLWEREQVIDLFRIALAYAFQRTEV